LKDLKLTFDKQNIAILGAGITGRFYEDLFSELELNVSYFTDKNASRINNINGIPVFPISKLLTESTDTTAIIAGNPSIVASIFKDLKTLDLPSNIHVLDGSGLISLARCALCMMDIEKNDTIDFSECSICYNKESTCSAFLKKTYKNDTGNSNKARFSLLGYILGQVCTLNCKHCCESVPYIKRPIMVETGQVVSDLRKISATTEFISRIEFIGGEPFLHRGLPEILNEVLKFNNVGYIVVFTNATVFPSRELLKTLSNPRIVVNFSGYKSTISDKLKERVDTTKKVLADAGVNFAYYNPDSRSWLDINYYDERTATEQELQDYNKHCFIARCVRVFNGSFYCCPHQYSGIQLGKIATDPMAYIDIHEHSDKELAAWFGKFHQLPYYPSCRYCNLPYDAPEVEPAIQL
jgi:organic radical activating enzyme